MATFPGGIEINPAVSAVPGAISAGVNMFQTLQQAAMMKREQAWNKDIQMFDYAIKASSIKGLSPETKAKILTKGFGAMKRWGFETPEVNAGSVAGFEPLVKNYQSLREAVEKGDISSDVALKEWRGQVANHLAQSQGEITEQEKLFTDVATKSFGQDETSKGMSDTTDALRKEFSSLPQVKDFQITAAALQKIRSGVNANSAAGDLSLIFAYMKLLDPGSTVREGEFATAQNAAGVPTQVMNLYNRARTGERLAAVQRKDFLKTAESIYSSQEKYVSGIEAQFRNIAKARGLSPDNVTLDLRAPAAEVQPAQVPAPVVHSASGPSTGTPRFKILSVEGK